MQLSVLSPWQKLVISTEAAHGVIVSSPAEKFASPPNHLKCSGAHPSRRGGAYLLGCPILRVFGEGWDVQIQSSPFNPTTNSVHSGRACVHACRKSPWRKALPLCRRQERSPKGEATNYCLCFCSCSCSYFPSFSAQKSHVKPLNHLTHCHSTTSAWHVSYAQPAILDIDRKQAKPRGDVDTLRG
jgi:hypothetical protein